MRKNGKRYLLIIVSIAVLVGMTAVPAFATGPTTGFLGNGPTYTRGSDLHPLEDVAYYATLEMRTFTLTDSTGAFRSWQEATVGDIVLVRDATGDPVLYDVTIENKGQPVGLIQIWAKKSKGVPFYTVSTSTVLLDLRQRVSEACQVATQTFGKIDVIETEVVYYQFPRRAFAMIFQRGGQTQRVLVDVTTQRVVTPQEVVPFASTLDAADLRASREEWAHMQKLLGQVEQLRSTQVYEEKVLNVPLFGQETGNYCGPAVVKMIFHYRHGWSYSQDYYAILLGTPPGGGTPWGNYGPTWGQLGHSATYFSFRAPWGTVKAEINSNRPFQSHIIQHVRVVRGYQEVFPWWKHVYLNDPMPVGHGHDWWEYYPSSWLGTILVY